MTALDELQQTVQEQALPRRARRLIIVLAIVCGVLLMVPSGILAWRLHVTSNFIAADQAADAERDQALQDLYDACQAASDCEIGDVPSPSELEEAAPDPTDSNVAVPGPPGATGPRGEPGSDGSDGADGADGATGPAGPIGPPGPNGEVGSTGAAGTSGADGVNGAPGAAGEPGAAGASGAPGATGPAGADGRGIASLVCDDAGRWQVTYTDGTSAEAGACRVDPIPPSEEPGIEVPLPILDP